MFDLAGDEATAFRRNRASPEKLQQMVDSGLGSAAGTSDSSSTSQEDAQHLESQSRIEMPERQVLAFKFPITFPLKCSYSK